MNATEPTGTVAYHPSALKDDPRFLCSRLGFVLSFMNAEFVAVGVYHNRRPAPWQFERFVRERHTVTTEMLDRLVEILYF